MDERVQDDSEVSNPTTPDTPAGERPQSEGLPDPRRPVDAPPTSSGHDETPTPDETEHRSASDAPAAADRG